MSRRTLFKLTVFLLLAAAVAGFYASPLRGMLTREHVSAFVAGLRELWYGPLVFILTFTVACVLAIPASIFVLAAGFIWGWKAGALYSLAGGLLGALGSFYVGRFLGEGLLDRFGRVGRMVAGQVDHAGFKSLLVLRFIPGIPFAVLNYGAGVAGVRITDFTAATLLGMTPSMLVFAYCADALFNGSMSEGDALRRLVVVCALMLVIVLLPQAVKRLTRRTAVDKPAA